MYVCMYFICSAKQTSEDFELKKKKHNSFLDDECRTTPHNVIVYEFVNALYDISTTPHPHILWELLHIKIFRYTVREGFAYLRTLNRLTVRGQSSISKRQSLILNHQS